MKLFVKKFQMRTFFYKHILIVQKKTMKKLLHSLYPVLDQISFMVKKVIYMLFQNMDSQLIKLQLSVVQMAVTFGELTLMKFLRYLQRYKNKSKRKTSLFSLLVAYCIHQSIKQKKLTYRLSYLMRQHLQIKNQKSQFLFILLSLKVQKVLVMSWKHIEMYIIQFVHLLYVTVKMSKQHEQH